VGHYANTGITRTDTVTRANAISFQPTHLHSIAHCAPLSTATTLHTALVTCCLHCFLPQSEAEWLAKNLEAESLVVTGAGCLICAHRSLSALSSLTTCSLPHFYLSLRCLLRSSVAVYRASFRLFFSHAADSFCPLHELSIYER
jgi:hypothetical protein